MIEIGPLGIPFTWCNKREASNAIFARLDRALIDFHYLKLYPKAVWDNVPIIEPNHTSILMNPSQTHALHRIVILDLRQKLLYNLAKSIYLC